MTREEAIRCLSVHSSTNGSGLCTDKQHYEAKQMAIKALAQEPCDDAISRESLKSKLKEHHDFFVNAYGGFSNLPLNDKSRVDEITACIAMVVNEPSVTPKRKVGRWIYDDFLIVDKCSCCGAIKDNYFFDDIHAPINFCPACGARMMEEQNDG